MKIELNSASVCKASPTVVPIDRWALAFFVANFSADDAVRTKRGAALWRAGKGCDPFPDLANVATLSMNEVKERFGDDGVALQAFLRDSPQALTAAKPAPIEFAVAALAKAMAGPLFGLTSQASFVTYRLAWARGAAG